ncbi:2-oxoglutarate and iron-dependent oxygenase domain-containing protein 3 isoform X1 [Ochotona curzoniae]|uniref:2-oxoglutarate and iron-dependent oxygenase domain-containing protein 3 isoform X1 n=1 Tax=Ochotona curzoniae TaxID=130825 RepID=UPI001B3496CD|nr:2-oxoglutarate and iron-dependent oxygenase domain-containing protein 3 isoform X1 [Ochotona curzoniae]
MAPQRRAAPKAPEGRAEAERRRPSSSRKDRAPQKGSRVWLQAAGLAAIVAVATLLLWSSLGADDGISGVLARRGEVVARRSWGTHIPRGSGCDWLTLRLEAGQHGDKNSSLPEPCPISADTSIRRRQSVL